MYGGMKQAIGERSRQANAPKCPAKYSSDDVEVQLYCTELFDFITTNPKKCCPMKWWSHEVVQELLAFPLLYTASYSPAKQDLAFLAAKQQEQGRLCFRRNVCWKKRKGKRLPSLGMSLQSLH